MIKFGVAIVMSMLLLSTTGAVSTGIMAFQNGTVVKLNYTAQANCTSSLGALYGGYTEAVNASAKTSCEIGVGLTPNGMPPIYMLVPAFAGLSIYGQTGWNATAQGYATYNGMTVVTQCGASGTPTSCNVTPSTKYYYSPGISNFEKQTGITSGTFGLPQGVLPKSAHDLLLPSGEGKTIVAAYVIRVGVHDPNIFPNATTGKCKQWTASNLSNPTGNCLNSTAALSRAISTMSSAIPAANKNNILYTSSGMAPYQATITTYTINQTRLLTGTYTTNVTSHLAKNINTSNTNAVRYVLLVSPPAKAPSNSVTNTSKNTPPPATSNTPSTATTQQSGSSNSLYLAGGVILVIVIIVILYLVFGKKKK